MQIETLFFIITVNKSFENDLKGVERLLLLNSFYDDKFNQILYRIEYISIIV